MKSIEYYKKLFYKIEFNIDMSCKRYFTSEYPKKINNKLLSKKAILDYEESDKFYYVDPLLIDDILNHIRMKNENKLDKNYNNECCVCFESIDNENRVYIKCRHSICIECIKMIINNKCPLCREEIFNIYIGNKYCVIMFGEKTNKYNFENGGYHSIKILYLPEFQNKEFKIFRNITYHNDNNIKKNFEDELINCINNGYNIIYQDKKEFIKWAEYISLDRLLNYKKS